MCIHNNVKMFRVSFNKSLRLWPKQQAFGFAKYEQKSKEELAAEYKKKQFGFVRSCIRCALKKRKSLTVEEWKSLEADLKKYFTNQHDFKGTVITVLRSLRPPKYDPMQNTRNFIEAHANNNLSLNRTIIELYGNKAIKTKLTEVEEQELIESYVITCIFKIIIEICKKYIYLLSSRCNKFLAQGMNDAPEMHLAVVTGLCYTKEWRKALELSHQTNDSLNILIRKSISENEIDLGWSLLTKLQKGLQNNTIIAFINYFDRNPADIPQNVERLLTACEKFKKVFNESSAQALTELLHKHGYHVDLSTTDYT